MSRILTVDIGAGTMDVLYLDTRRSEHFKAVVTSPVASLARQIEACFLLGEEPPASTTLVLARVGQPS